MLSDDQKKGLRDLALGKVINQSMTIEDQIAAIRKQVQAISESTKTPLVDDFEKLVDVVNSKIKGK